MKLIDRWELDKGARIRDNSEVEIICDEDDQFSISYLNNSGQPVIFGVNQCSFPFWRNRATET